MGSEVVIGRGFDACHTKLEYFSSIELSALIIPNDSDFDSFVVGIE
jgi:hypothetical protein